MEKTSAHPKPPKISVLIPCYRQARFLPEALDSVLHQDFQDFELIASDDASSDNTFSILQDYANRDSRIRIFRQSINLGMVENWNFCLTHARGEAVKLIGGDDRLVRVDCLSRQWQRLQAPGVALVACGREIIDADNRFLECVANLPYGFSPPSKIIPKMLEHQDNLIGEPICCLFRRKNSTRGFHPEYLQNTDIEMWFHILRFGGLAYDPEPLVSFRRHTDQNTNIHNKSGLSLEEHRFLMLKEALDSRVPLTIKFRVLRRAQDMLRYAPSERAALAAADLEKEIGPMMLSLPRIYYEVQRTLKRWGQSIGKRVQRTLKRWTQSIVKRLPFGRIVEQTRRYDSPLVKAGMESFDWKNYLNTYEDLRLSGMRTKQEAWNHWINYGKDEERTLEWRNTTKIHRARFGNLFFLNMAGHLISARNNLKLEYKYEKQFNELGVTFHRGTKTYDEDLVLTDNSFLDIIYENNDKPLKRNIVFTNEMWCQSKDFCFLLAQYFKNPTRREGVMSNNFFKSRYNSDNTIYNNDLYVHVRLADAKQYNYLPFEYYDKILSRLTFDRGHISSDALQDDTCCRLIKKYSLHAIHDSPVRTLMLGSTCRHIVLSGGAFSWLVGFFGFFSDVYCPSQRRGVWYGNIFVFQDWKKIDSSDTVLR
jgi:glycosyltransferase involved in cell wall biosynthesis